MNARPSIVGRIGNHRGAHGVEVVAVAFVIVDDEAGLAIVAALDDMLGNV